MNNRRIQLHHLLCEVLGSNNVYYQAPESVKMKYPAIRYHRDGINNNHADNKIYYQKTRYRVTVIDPDPDSEIVSKVSQLDSCRFEKHYVSDNLNHDVFLIYY